MSNTNKEQEIIFLGDFSYNAGSTQTLHYYQRIANSHSCLLRLCGEVDEPTQKIFPTVSLGEWNSDALLVYIFENILFVDPDINPGLLDRHLDATKKNTRLIIDTDAHYVATAATSEEKKWKETYELIDGEILQPVVNSTQTGRVHSFPFFTYPEQSAKKSKTPDFVYVGNNWHREAEMTSFLQSVTENDVAGERNIHLYGQWWESVVANFPQVLLSPSVSANDVIPTMSTGRFNPVFVFEKLLKRKLYTPRMFETFAADTIPLLPSELTYAEEIFGEEAKDFLFSPNTLVDVIASFESDIDGTAKKLGAVRNTLQERFSPTKLLHFLLSFR